MNKPTTQIAIGENMKVKSAENREEQQGEAMIKTECEYEDNYHEIHIQRDDFSIQIKEEPHLLLVSEGNNGDSSSCSDIKPDTRTCTPDIQNQQVNVKQECDSNHQPENKSTDVAVGEELESWIKDERDEEEREVSTVCTMDPKKVTEKRGKEKKKKRVFLSIQTKQEIIEKHEKGMRLVDLAKLYGRNVSTISTFLRQKEAIKAITPSKGLAVISKRRSAVNDEMERLLLLWIKEKEMAGDIVTDAIICEKATVIFNDLVEEDSGEGKLAKEHQEFKASRGWFEKFKKRTELRSVVRHGEASRANHKAADEFVQKFKQLVTDEGYVAQQVFNCDETGLFWKRMPRHTFITAEEKKMPGHKPMNDRLTLALCSNASGDCKIKPLLVYHSENPRAFKVHKILKERLQVLWRANAKAWVTRQFFVEWVNLVFGPAVKRYLEENDLPFKCLLVLDNAPAHPPGLEDDVLEEFSFIKVLYLPSNTTSILQPMDQELISNFKKLYTKHLFKRCFEITENTQLTLREFWKQHFNIVDCLEMIDTAWQEVTMHNLNAAWRKLWPDAVTPPNMEGFELEGEVQPEVEEIISLGKCMGLEVNEEDISELIREQNEELSTMELKELEAMQYTAVQEKFKEDEEQKADMIPLARIKAILEKFHEVSEFVEKNHPEQVFTSRAIAHYDNVCLGHFRRIVKSRQKQTSLDQSFTKRQAKTTSEREHKPKRAKIDEDSSKKARYSRRASASRPPLPPLNTLQPRASIEQLSGKVKNETDI
ncbi:tigger transposable element-derived protein 1-like isoform X2 [Antennarius striatus]|uniref:tigger transposable element-derived protein 1-like isoform X2 n=1 Tax=Antennarius striatus TaxID=241820 RepID=UPI0035B310D3